MKVQLSKLASYKLEQLLTYLETEWSAQTREQFLRQLSDRFEVIKKIPKSYPPSEIRLELRKMVVTKQTSVLYKIGEETISIVTIFDNRQDPNKIDEEIRKYFG